MKRKLKLIISLTIFIGLLVSGITLDFDARNNIIKTDCNVYAASNSMTVSFPKDTSRSRSKQVTISNLYSISGISVNTGSVSYSVNGNQVTIYVSGGSSTSSSTSAKAVSGSVTKDNCNSFPSYLSYNDGTYSGNMYPNGSYVTNVVSGSPAGEITIQGYQYGYAINNYIYYKSTGWKITSSYSTDQPTMYYGPDPQGYQGTLYRQYADLVGDTGVPTGSPPDGTTYTRTRTFRGTYMGTISKPDTRVYSFTQNYSGTAYGPTTYYYSYTVTVNYITNINPSISINLPSSNTVYSAQPGKNALALAGTIYDADAGDSLKVYYRIDGSAGMAGTQYGDAITSNNSNQPFPSQSQSIDVSSISEGEHILYAWVEDNYGGKSAESAIPFKMDKSAPSAGAPTLTANSTSQITVQPSATDPTTNNVSSGLNTDTPHIYNRNGSDVGTWRSGNLVDTGLSPNTQYTYKYKARDNVLNTSGYSATASKYTLAAAPSLTVGNPMSSSLDVSTSDSNPSYTQYQIWTTAGGTRYVTQTGSLSDTPQWITLTNKRVTVTGLSPNTGYTFYAISRNGDGAVNQTTVSASGTTLYAPQPAANLAITNISNNSISVSWSPNGNPSTMIYNLVLQDPDNLAWLSNPETTLTSHTFSGLTPNTKYNVWVRVRNEKSEWATSQYQLFGQPYTNANPPTNLILDFATHSSLSLNWEQNSNPANTQYRVVLTDPSTGGWLNNSDWQADISSWTFTELIPSTQYKAWVQARNSKGIETAWYCFGIKSTLAEVPGNGSIEAVTNSSIAASWDSNGNSAYTCYSLAAFNTDNMLIKQNAWSTDLSGALTGLNAKTPYTIRVKARNPDNVETDWHTISMETFTYPDLPLPPADLTASVNSKSSITICWNQSEDAASYDLLRNNNLITNVTSPYNDSGLTPETTYTYQVRAINPTGSSEYSCAISAATLPAPPGVPSGLHAAPSTTSTALVWNPVEKAEGYEVEADGQVNDLGNTTSYTHGLLSQGTQHIYRLRAYNAGGYGEWTEQLTVSTLLSTPENVTASSTSNTMIISWKPVVNASAYEVGICGVVYTVPETSFRCEGLNPSAVYSYKVRAVNATSISLWSEERTKTTLPAPPDSPANITSDATKTTVTLHWDAVPDAASYDVTADGQLYTGINGTSFTQTGLSPGSDHMLKVRSRNSGGKSEWSDEITQPTLSAPPNVPVNLIAAATADSIIIRWDEVTEFGGYEVENTTQSALSVVDGYEIEVDSTTCAALTVNEYVHLGLTPASEHTYRVRSIRNDIFSEWSTLLIAKTRTNDLGIPINLNASVSDTSIILSWDAVNNATGYDIDFEGAVVNNGSSTTSLFTGLHPETRYTFRVRTLNSGVAGDWSSTLSCVTLQVKPDMPDYLSAKPFENSIVLSWNPVLDALSYDIMIDESSIHNTQGSEYVHDGLFPLTQHTYRIRSVNENGSSSWSELISVSTLSDIPDVPANIRLIPLNNSIKILWDRVEGIDSYEIKIDDEAVVNVLDTQYLHTGLAAGSTHTYMVRAVKGLKTSGWSEIATESALPDKPSMPMNIAVTPKTNEIIITYESVNGAEGYDIYFDGVLIDNGHSTTFIKIGLEAGTQHSIRVRARNMGGTSEWSGEITVFTLAGLLGIPEGISTASELNSITVNWNPLPGTIAYEIEADEIVINIGLNTQYIDGSLMPGTRHSYRVRALNEGGQGEWSSIITVPTKLAAPDGLYIEQVEDTIQLAWDSIEGADTYDIEIDGVPVANVNGTSYIHERIIPNRQYTYRVRAVNAAVIGDWCSSMVFRIPAAVFKDTFIAGDKFYFEIDARNVSNIESKRFIIAFAPSEIEIVDLYAMTDAIDLAEGNIKDSNLRVLELSPGKIVLMVQEDELNGELSGLVNTILFKVINNGEVSITYSMN